jgi:hypothetical protein
MLDRRSLARASCGHDHDRCCTPFGTTTGAGTRYSLDVSTTCLVVGILTWNYDLPMNGSDDTVRNDTGFELSGTICGLRRSDSGSETARRSE